MMSNIEIKAAEGLRLDTFPIRADELEREVALRGRFAEFWSTARGEPTAIYDEFISATPLTGDVLLDGVDDNSVQGWWVRPAGAEADRAILYIHGGGYVQGSAKAYRGFASQIASRTKLSVFVMDYPLAPEAPLPSAPESALRTYRWLLSTGVRHIAIAGDSAGGGIALLTLARLARHLGETTAVAGVVFSPWVDLAFTGRSMIDAKIQDPLLTYENLQDCARKYLGGADPRDPLASPLYGELKGLPPVLVQVGTDERLFDDSRQYAVRAARAGTSVQLEVWEGMHHVFQLDVAHLHSSRVALDRAATFLTRTLIEI
jgi:acetyl esterase/lipase